MMPDLNHQDYVDSIAGEAIQIAAAMRDDDPKRTADHLTAVCTRNPQRAAHLIMALATWVDIEGPMSALTGRAAAIAESRIQAQARRGVITGSAVA
ncbi:hypothetical protein GV792_04885 [Nocardia cyriacigeorgica]|uniref:hypothetical protein n=1 Tax=Nocardia cyriacigeorgica TaxID=135487 RepID=UPI0013BD19CF|nr:hypothetical protein [Nocardia cyriacigeorgica]NEW49379.1 hypothetical protein [Nocardia cyriacigeorgica]